MVMVSQQDKQNRAQLSLLLELGTNGKDLRVVFTFNMLSPLSSPNAVTCFLLSTSHWTEKKKKKNEPEFKTLICRSSKN